MGTGLSWMTHATLKTSIGKPVLFHCEYSNREIGSRREHVSWGGIDMTTEELETILDDLDFMVETVRQNCGTVSFLSVAHSARKIRQILKSLPDGF